MYKQDYKRVRFHIEFGPASLFERVQYKMKDVTKLYMDGTHFRKRLSERDIPDAVISKLQQFDSSVWTLKTASVREDRGKFVDSTWEVEIDGVRYWVTIGMGNYIRTIVVKETSGIEKCIREGTYFDFVDQVNKDLMEESRRQAKKC